MSQSAAAPEKIRMNVKLAASMLVCFSAARQSNELPANAIIANSVRMKIRAGFTAARDVITAELLNARDRTSNGDYRRNRRRIVDFCLLHNRVINYRSADQLILLKIFVAYEFPRANS
jgi:hypothetical protein